jgi:general transcription factor 3C polypeptide 3 (transcription factor C subunit 4)
METKQYRFGADALRKAFDWHIQHFTGPDDDSSPEPNTMTMENVINLTDLQIQLDELEEAIVIIRRGQRWLQGRRNEKQWDVVEDDREYDTPNVIRGDKTVDDEGEIRPLDINLRQRLAMIRLKLGDDDEAKVS